MLVVIPAFNEEASVGKVVEQVVAMKYDVLVVDDGSSDRTSYRAKEAGAQVLRFPFNLGVGVALRAGLRFAVEHGYRCVVQVDGDGQHPVEQIEDLRAAASKFGAQLVIGSRFISDDSTLTSPLPRLAIMKLLGFLASRYAGTRITDATSGFRIIVEPLLGEFARHLPGYYLGDTFEALVAAARADYVIHEIPANLSKRMHGASSENNVTASLQVAKTLIVSMARLRAPLQSVTHSWNEVTS